MLNFKEFVFLVENRLDYLKKVHTNLSTKHDTLAKHTEPHDIIDHFSNADPTPKKKHTQWIISQYKKQAIRQEDNPRIHKALSTFEKHKNRLPNKDLNSYKSLSNLEDTVEPHEGVEPLSNNEKKRITKSEGTDLIHTGDGVTIHHIKTHEAAKLYGAGTKWCTAAKDPVEDEWGGGVYPPNHMFDHYNLEGPIHVIQTDKGRKYQYHEASDQFMDEKDRKVGEKEFNKLLDDHPSLENEKTLQHFIFNKGNIERQKKILHSDDIKSKSLNNYLENNRYLETEHLNNIIPKILEKHYDKLDRNNKERLYKNGRLSVEIRQKLLDNFSEDSDSSMRRIAIKTNDPKYLNKAINDSDEWNRSMVADRGGPEIHEKLQDDPSELVRDQIARKNSNYHDKYVKDKHHEVRSSVARFGTDKHRDQLIHDENENVRAYVAKYGTHEHRDQLMNDESSYIRHNVIERGTDELRLKMLENSHKISDGHQRNSQISEILRKIDKSHFDRLIKHENPEIRKVIAAIGDKHHRDILKDDPDNIVRNEVWANMHRNHLN